MHHTGNRDDINYVPDIEYDLVVTEVHRPLLSWRSGPLTCAGLCNNYLLFVFYKKMLSRFIECITFAYYRIFFFKRQWYSSTMPELPGMFCCGRIIFYMRYIATY